MLLSANAGRDSTPRNQPHARVESQTFRDVERKDRVTLPSHV